MTTKEELETRAFALVAAPMTEEEKKLYEALTKSKKKKVSPNTDKSLTELLGGAFH